LNGRPACFTARPAQKDNGTMEPSNPAILNPNPGIFVVIILMGIASIFLPRKYALFPLFLVAAYVTLGQYVVIAGANFTMLRILVVFAFARALIRSDYGSFSPNGLDKAMIAWSVSTIVTYTLLWQEGHAFVNRMGLCFDTVGVYFACRLYILDIDDVSRIFSLCAVLVVPLAVAMLYEYFTGRNLFAVLGGVPALSEIRNGRVRCQGSFRHPILMGTFGATMLPLILSLWWQRGVSKTLVVAGAFSCCIIVACSGSSGAFMATLYGVAGLLFWFLRDNMRTVRWGIVLALVIMQLVMKSPFWYILARLSSLTGGTGWHRAYLIDQAIRYINEWWLVGTRVTAHWMPTGLLIDPTNTDITNQYLLEGVNGGLITMIIFISIIVLGFKYVGKTVRMIDSDDFPVKILVWSMGAALFAHSISFVSVSYFDQIKVFWYFLIAAIAISAEFTIEYSAQRIVALDIPLQPTPGGKTWT
jgi:hypothetical protein